MVDSLILSLPPPPSLETFCKPHDSHYLLTEVLSSAAQHTGPSPSLRSHPCSQHGSTELARGSLHVCAVSVLKMPPSSCARAFTSSQFSGTAVGCHLLFCTRVFNWWVHFHCHCVLMGSFAAVIQKEAEGQILPLPGSSFSQEAGMQQSPGHWGLLFRCFDSKNIKKKHRWSGGVGPWQQCSDPAVPAVA